MRRFVIDLDIENGPEDPADLEFKNILNAIAYESVSMRSNTCGGNIEWHHPVVGGCDLQEAKWSLDALAPHQGKDCWKLTIFKEEEE